MFEKESKKYQEEVIAKRDYPHCISVDWQRGADFGYNKCKEEINKNGLALQLDMDRTIEQNFALKDELNKAVEIIEGLLDFDFLPDVDIKKQAEEFLSEVVKW